MLLHKRKLAAREAKSKQSRFHCSGRSGVKAGAKVGASITALGASAVVAVPGGIFPVWSVGYRRLPENDADASGEGVTRHPGAGAAE